MHQSGFSEEQIIGIVREQEAGAAAAELCRKHGISDATFYKRKAGYGGLEVSEAKRLRALGPRSGAGAPARPDRPGRGAAGR